MINQLSIVTKQLQHQTLEEPYEFIKAANDDRDSGTESDNETKFEEPESAIVSEMSSDISSGCSVRSRPTSQTSTDTICEEIVGEMLPPAPRRGTRTPRGHPYNLRTPEGPADSPRPAESPIENLLDSAIMSDSDPVEHHSSEEELEILTGASWGPPEKRKWSQVARLSLTDSGSSDDELGILSTTPAPVKFRTSPPLEAHKPLRSLSPPNKNPRPSLDEENSNKIKSSSVPHTPSAELNGRVQSPRKRHRHTRPYRPCLDFEKMQQMKNRAVTQWRNSGELSLSFF